MAKSPQMYASSRWEWSPRSEIENMLNVRKFRATTTRDALELIKQDLGEDAFVLETKRVRTGGFLGFRSSMQVEVSAAAASNFNMSTVPANETGKSGTRSQRDMKQTDDIQVSPVPSRHLADQNKARVIRALSERTTAANEYEKAKIGHLALGKPKIDTVELNPEAPRIIHPKKEAAKPRTKDDSTAAMSNAEMVPATVSRRELELLRAELREVKFSLGAIANRNANYCWESEIDLNVFGDVFDAPFHSVYIELTDAGIPPSMARQFVADAVPLHKSNPVAARHLTRATLLRALSTYLKFVPDALHREKQTALAVIGATGVGKTTTVAKLAARIALHEHRRVELVTLDTYRIAAVEQLKTYAEIIGAGCHVVRSVLELDAILRRLPSDASVLIDTTGRSPHDLADQYELTDYFREHKEIRKCLAIQATTHPLDAVAAIRKFEMYGADCLTVTQMDETTRPGAVLETIAQSNLPLAYFCTGQRVPEDLQIATAEALTDRIIAKRL